MHSAQFTALLDANVLYPFLVRDLLLSLAEENLYRPKWSKHIEEEWIRNLLTDRPDLNPEKIENIAITMNLAFEDAMVSDYETLITSLSLPDPDDRHVLAAAIVSRSDVIVTMNLRDFDVMELGKYNMDAVHPDTFIVNLIDLDNEKAIKAIQKMVQRRKNPPVGISDLIQRIENNKLSKAAKRFSDIMHP
ncbi:MAG: PIN domain-containing protein [Cyclonatronaceae bacterium]